MYKEIRAILGSSCLSEDTHKCECDGNCYEHENAKIEELIAKHDSELLDKVAERINSLHYDTCDGVTRRIEHQLKAEVFKVINEMKAEVFE